MGVWIETDNNTTKRYRVHQVTPFVGVWIETISDDYPENYTNVTPFVGVWIETKQSWLIGRVLTSHPSWVCGLKLWNQTQYVGHY